MVSAPHWHVLGAGAIGCLFAAALRRAGCEVTLLLREGSQPGERTVLIERDRGTERLVLPTSTPAAENAIDHLLVTTKAYDVAQAVAGVRRRLREQSQVLLLANGMGFAAEVTRDAPWLQLFHGTTTEGAWRIAPLHVRHAGRGTTRIGRSGVARPAPWFRCWRDGLPDCIWDPDIDRALWLKLAINCAINPLTALHRCVNGELARRPELAAEVARLCDEIAAISAAAGYAEAARGIHEAVAAVIAATAANRSSMLQDVLAGRRTEIEHITGYLLAVAGRCGIEAPRNRAVMAAIGDPVR
jgi:2-dehydropantoate 2-reductase